MNSQAEEHLRALVGNCSETCHSIKSLLTTYELNSKCKIKIINLIIDRLTRKYLYYDNFLHRPNRDK